MVPGLGGSCGSSACFVKTLMTKDLVFCFRSELPPSNFAPVNFNLHQSLWQVERGLPFESNQEETILVFLLKCT